MSFLNLIEQANLCPICDRLPKESIEPGYSELLVFLRCPNGHPYACCGRGLMEAINMWNRYIELHRQMDSKRMMQKVGKTMHKSFCPHCQEFTNSFTQFSKETPSDKHLGYVLVKQECIKCHLIKSQKEAA